MASAARFDRRGLVAAGRRRLPVRAQVDVERQVALAGAGIVVRVAARDCLAVGVVGPGGVAPGLEGAGQVEPGDAPRRAEPGRGLEVADRPRQVAVRLGGEVRAEPVVGLGGDGPGPVGERRLGGLGDRLAGAPEPDQGVGQVGQDVGGPRLAAPSVAEVRERRLEVVARRVGSAQQDPAGGVVGVGAGGIGDRRWRRAVCLARVVVVVVVAVVVRDIALEQRVEGMERRPQRRDRRIAVALPRRHHRDRAAPRPRAAARDPGLDLGHEHPPQPLRERHRALAERAHVRERRVVGTIDRPRPARLHRRDPRREPRLHLRRIDRGHRATVAAGRPRPLIARSAGRARRRGWAAAGRTRSAGASSGLRNENRILRQRATLALPLVSSVCRPM